MSKRMVAMFKDNKMDVDPTYFTDEELKLLGINLPHCELCSEPNPHRSNYEAIKGIQVWLCDDCDDMQDGDSAVVGDDFWRGLVLK